MRIDLSGAKTLDTLIPKGTYQATITDGEVRESKDGPSDKNPTGQYVHWEFTLEGGDYDSWKQWKNTPLGGDGIGFLKEVLSASGKYTDESLSGEIDFEVDEVVGSTVMVTVRQREYPKGEVPKEYVNDVGKVRKFEGTVGGLLP